MPRILVACPCVLSILTITGCTAPLVKHVAAFSTAAAPALTEMSNAYAAVQTVHAGAVLAQRVDSFDRTSLLKPAPPGTFGAPEDLKVRQEVLALLANYVNTLAEVSGIKAATAADANSRAGATALSKLANDGLPQLTTSTSATTSASDTSGAAKAIDALSRIAMERHRRRALPGILRKSDGPVQTICALIEKDFGDPETGGLRKVVRTDYGDWLAHEDAAIRDHPNGYTYPARRAAITALYALQAREAADDAVLAQAETVLRDFASAHHALATAGEGAQSPGFREQLGDLIVASGQLAALQEKETTP